jgi:hypothetical protein
MIVGVCHFVKMPASGKGEHGQAKWPIWRRNGLRAIPLGFGKRKKYFVCEEERRERAREWFI